MASNQDKSGGLGLMDVLASWEAFETINSCRVTMMGSPEPSSKGWHLTLEATAWSWSTAAAGGVRLASVKLICSATEWKSLDTVAFRLLYALDAQLALLEFDKVSKR